MVILVQLKHKKEFNFKVIKYYILLRVIPESKSQRGENKFVKLVPIRKGERYFY